MKDKLWWILLGLAAILMLSNARAGEWNDKPVMCEMKEIALKAIRDKGELLLISGTQSTRVRNETGLATYPIHLPLQVFVNLQTKTYTIIEDHPTYESVCVLSYGNNFSSILLDTIK